MTTNPRRHFGAPTGRADARAATRHVDADGNVSAPVELGALPASYDDARAVLWSVDAADVVSGPVDLGFPELYPDDTGFVAAGAFAINPESRIVGWSERSSGNRYATHWQPGSGDEPPPPTGDGPTASFDYECDKCATCHFTDTSTGEIVGWVWESDAGHFSTEQDATFLFENAGTYTVTLTVTDVDGLTDSAAATITCRSHPRFGTRCE